MKSRRHSLELTTVSQNGSLICHLEHHSFVAVQTARRSAILPTEAHLETHLLETGGRPPSHECSPPAPGRCSRSCPLQPLRRDLAPARTSALAAARSPPRRDARRDTESRSFLHRLGERINFAR